MRLHLQHTTRYAYDPPARGALQLLRLTPRSHEGQYVRSWRIDVDRDCRLEPGEDPFGNITHVFAIDDQLSDMTVVLEGELETHDMTGLVRGTVERFPPDLYLRETRLTHPDPALIAFARDAAGSTSEPLALCHAMTTELQARIRFDTDATQSETTAAEAFAQRHGVCQDHAHILIAALRARGIPARYVAGHLFRGDGQQLQEAGHAWVEAHLPDLGWVGFDPANGVCPNDGYVRVAVGLDSLGAAPVRGTRFGGGTETMRVTVRVLDAQLQRQE